MARTAVRPGAPSYTQIDVLKGAHVTEFHYDLLDRHEAMLGSLTTVQPGGSIKWSSTAPVHSAGSFQMDDDGVTDIDWLTARIRPWTVLTDRSGRSTKHRLGVYLPAAPTEDWTDYGRSWNVEITDKLSILDRQIMTGADDLPVAYSIPAGTNVIDTVVEIIEATGEAAPAIGPGDETIQGDMTWDMGTSRLKVINELLKAGGYFSLWCDDAGQYRVTEYVVASQRQPVYLELNPFADGVSSLMATNFTRDRDIDSIPNRYFAVSQGDGENDAMVSVATNVDDASPFSYNRVGGWIDGYDDTLEATSQAALDAQAQMLLSQATSVASTLSIQHAFLPDLRMNDAVQFTTGKRRGGFNMLCYLSDLTIPLDPASLCQSTLHEAII